MKIINIKRCVRFYLFVFLFAGSQLYSYSQTMTTALGVRVKNDLCDQGIGEAELSISADMESDYVIKWTINKSFFGFMGTEIRYGKTIYELKGGWSGKVELIPFECPDVVIYERPFSIGKDDCSLDISISVSSDSKPCDEIPTATIKVKPNGGTPPYTYSWGNNFLTVSTTGTYYCLVSDSNGKSGRDKVTVSIQDLQCSSDPNEIKGPDGYGEEMMVAGDELMSYTISFENDPDFATAPASRVEIEYPIPDEQKLSSFRLTDFGFGQFVFTVPSNTNSYYQRLDLADSLGVWVDVTAGIDIINSRAYWIFQSVDPATGFEPQSAAMGFLPINDGDGSGEGYVSFYIMPANNVSTGDTVAADASIVFDDNAAIPTNIWVNKFDVGSPVSRITNLVMNPSDSTNCSLSFEAEDDDNGSGVKSIELFVSENNAPYVSAGSFDYGENATYAMTDGSVYQFISVATDNVGNVEDFKTAPDTTINYNGYPTDILLSNNFFYENAAFGSVIGELSTVDNGDVFVYELVDGDGSNDNELFSVNGNNLTTNYDFNCSDILTYLIRLRSTDVGGLSVGKSFEINMIKTNPSYNLEYEGVVCQFGQFSQYGWEIDLTDSLPGTYIYERHLETTLGCDSIRTLSLTVNPAYNLSYVDTIAFGDSYFKHGLDISNPAIGTYHYLIENQTTNGCDSIVTVDLVVTNMYYTHHHELYSGWNWYSTYIDITGTEGLQYLEQQLGDNALNVKTQTDFLIHQLGMWLGGIDSITEKEMFMIQVSSDNELILEGKAVNANELPFVLSPGWTWMGYPLADSLPLQSALASLNSHNGDIIKSQENFAQYYESLGWMGDLNTMVPGCGYIYHNTSAEPDTFIYNHPRRNVKLIDNVTTEFNNWKPNVHYFQDNMNIIAVVDLDGEELMSENYEVGVFATDGVRGSSKLMYVEQLDRCLVFITVHGDMADDINFMLYNLDEDERIPTMAKETMVFSKNTIHGDVNEPLVLHFSTLNDIDEQDQTVLAIYPNPARSMVTVDCPDMKSITVTSSLGVDVLKITEIHADKYIVNMKDLVAGIYYFTVNTANGVFVQKVVKTR